MRQDENSELLCRVYEALQEKGYRPLGQIVGYLLTEDPAYITNHKGARQLIRKIDRDRLLHDIVADYLERKERDDQQQWKPDTRKQRG